jgi:hypothetical protein
MVFEEARCPSCNSDSYFPLSRWVKPAMASEGLTVRKTAKNASLVLLGSGVAFGLWKALQRPDDKKKPDDMSPRAKSPKAKE